MSSTVYIDLDRSGRWFVVRTAYSFGFVEELKARIPAWYRSWVPDENAWCVHRKRWEDVEPLFRKHYGNDVVIELSSAAEAAQIDLMVEQISDYTAHDCVVLGIRADAHVCVVHAAYHALEAAALAEEANVMETQGIYPAHKVRASYERLCAFRGVFPESSLSGPNEAEEEWWRGSVEDDDDGDLAEDDDYTYFQERDGEKDGWR